MRTLSISRDVPVRKTAAAVSAALVIISAAVAPKAAAAEAIAVTASGQQEDWVDDALSVLWTGIETAAPLLLLADGDAEASSSATDIFLKALKADGHTVTAVVTSDKHGMSGNAVTGGSFKAEKIGKAAYAVDATPATAALFGVNTVMKKRPDLVIAGVDIGARVGSAKGLSSAVGAATTALTQFNKPIPAIAISTVLVDPDDPQSSANMAHYRNIADFTTRLVRKLQHGKKGPRMPNGLGLHVSYPALPPEAIKGVKLAVQGQASRVAWDFKKTGTKTYEANPATSGVKKDVKNADTTFFEKGYITIVPFDGDYTANGRNQKTLKFLKRLEP